MIIGSMIKREIGKTYKEEINYFGKFIIQPVIVLKEVTREDYNSYWKDAPNFTPDFADCCNYYYEIITD